MGRVRLGVLISGRGSNLAALIAACAEPGFPAEIALVISNRDDAGGLAHADDARIPRRVIAHQDFADRAAFESALDQALRGAAVELVCLAGFMRLLTAAFVDRWYNRLVNIHPSLLPAFTGLRTHERAIEAGCRIAGCTVHLVRASMDAGPILVQAAVPVRAGDTGDTLADRVLEAEHRCYPLAIRLIAEGRLRIDGERAWLDAPEHGAHPSIMLISPEG